MCARHGHARRRVGILDQVVHSSPWAVQPPPTSPLPCSRALGSMDSPDGPPVSREPPDMPAINARRLPVRLVVHNGAPEEADNAMACFITTVQNMEVEEAALLAPKATVSEMRKCFPNATRVDEAETELLILLKIRRQDAKRRRQHPATTRAVADAAAAVDNTTQPPRGVRRSDYRASTRRGSRGATEGARRQWLPQATDTAAATAREQCIQQLESCGSYRGVLMPP